MPKPSASSSSAAGAEAPSAGFSLVGSDTSTADMCLCGVRLLSRASRLDLVDASPRKSRTCHLAKFASGDRSQRPGLAWPVALDLPKRWRRHEHL